MIKITRLDGELFLLNAELIRYVESRPDTIVTLISGERIMVRESMDDVMRLAVDYQRSKHLLPPVVRPLPPVATLPSQPLASQPSPSSAPTSLRELSADRTRDRRTAPVAFASI
jgi:flagellar protein FlbD